MRKINETDFVTYAEFATPRLRRLGFLICGDWQRSEDAVQDTLFKLYRAWRNIESEAAVGVYTRQILSRQLIDESRRPWRRERPHERLPEPPVEVPDHDVTWVIRAALADLPRRQRAVLALRFYEEFSIREVAEIMQISEGTVKSQSTRGLQNLRALLGDAIASSDEGRQLRGNS